MTRRSLIGTLTSAPFLRAAKRGRVYASEEFQFPDPATEFPVDRMTDPKYASSLPFPYGRVIAKRGAQVLFSSERESGWQAYRLEFRNGQIKQLTEASALHRHALALLPDDRSFCFFDGPSLRLASFSNGKDREIYRISDADLGTGLGISSDGKYATFVENSGKSYRLRLVDLKRGEARTLAESGTEIAHPIPRPRQTTVLYQNGGGLWIVGFDGQQKRRLCDAISGAGSSQWAPDGKTLFYLARERTVALREHSPETSEDQRIAATTQFVSCAPNADASVFVGVSGSIATRYILLLLRVVRRELTLCEHKSSDPRTVFPLFSPTSQRVYFQSDRDGKPAIYSVALEKFLEKTEGEKEQ